MKQEGVTPARFTRKSDYVAGKRKGCAVVCMDSSLTSVEVPHKRVCFDRFRVGPVGDLLTWFFLNLEFAEGSFRYRGDWFDLSRQRRSRPPTSRDMRIIASECEKC